MTTHKAIREALEALLVIGEWASDVLGVWMVDDPFGTLICKSQYPKEATFIAACNPVAIRALLADLDVKTDSLKAKADRIDRLGELVERETAARREAQEQLYAERERHTAEVKKLQAEIGRLKVLRREPMTEADLLKCLIQANCLGTVRMTHENGPYDIDWPSHAAVRLKGAIEAHHHITQKEQSK